MEKISAVYKIVNTVTGDFYVGSSKNVLRRWAEHKKPSVWKKEPNKLLYVDMQKYGIDKFRFQILAPVMPEHLKQVEQEFIEMLKPTYNNANAKGLNVERNKEWHRKYHLTDVYKEYQQSNRGKEAHRKAYHKYNNHLCSYNGEVVRLGTLRQRFLRAGIKHPTLEAKKYLLHEQQLIDVKGVLK